MKHFPPTLRGFSLVELTLALGIGAVALVTVLGLLGVAADANGSAGRDTNVVTMANAVMNELRGAPSFESLFEAKPRAKFIPKPATMADSIASKVPLESTYFFNRDGLLVEANHPDALYECTVKKTADLPKPDERKGLSNLLKIELIFTSPVGVPIEQRPNRHVIHASIARF